MTRVHGWEERGNTVELEKFDRSVITQEYYWLGKISAPNMVYVYDRPAQVLHVHHGVNRNIAVVHKPIWFSSMLAAQGFQAYGIGDSWLCLSM